MSASDAPTPIGQPNATTGAPTVPVDQVFEAARNLPDFISRATLLDPATAKKWTGKALLASKTIWGSALVLLVTAVARRYTLGWDQDTVDVVAGSIDLSAIAILRMISQHPITGLFRSATPHETIARITASTPSAV